MMFMLFYMNVADCMILEGYMYRSILKNYSNEICGQKYGIRCSINKPTNVYPIHRHDFVEFEYVFEGEMEHEINGELFSMSPGSCYGLFPGDLHSFNASEKLKIYHISISFKDAPEMIRMLINNMSFPFAGKICDSDREMVNYYFDKIRECVNVSTEFEWEKLTAYVTLMLTLFYENSKVLTGKSAREGYGYVESAIDYIKSHLSEQITLNEVAEYLHLSPNYFCNVFKKISGTTFLKYINMQRVELAKELLTYSEKSVLDISMECGFGSFSAFSRTFKTICKCTPTEFKNRAFL